MSPILLFLTFINLSVHIAAVAIHQKPLLLQSPTKSHGCHKPLTIAYPGKTRKIVLANDQGERSFLIHLPNIYDYQPLPLMLHFHGAMNDSYYQENLTKFSSPRYNAVMIYPQGTNDTWQGDPSLSPSVDDVAFTQDIIDYLLSEICISPQRIYASGKSIAGGFVDILACSSISHYFAAFAMASGAFYRDKPSTITTPEISPNLQPSSSSSYSSFPDSSWIERDEYLKGEKAQASVNSIQTQQITKECHHKHLTPIINIHGLADDTIPYNGSPDRKGLRLPSIPSYLQNWARRNGCREPYYAMKNTSIHHDEATLMQWKCSSSSSSSHDDNHGDEGFRNVNARGEGAGGRNNDIIKKGNKNLNRGKISYKSDINHYAVKGLKHAWPALTPNDDGPASVIDGSDVIYQFFNQWSSEFTG